MNELSELTAQASAPQAAEDTPVARPRVSFCRRFLPWLVWLACVLLPVGGLLVLLLSESGLRLTSRLAEELSGGRLTIEEPNGSLAKTFSLLALHWRDDTLDLQLTGVQVDWRPGELRRGKLAIVSLSAESLRIAYRGNDEAVVPPTSLHLPLAVQIDHLHIGRIELADYAHPQDATRSVGEDFNASLSSTAAEHRLTAMRVRLVQIAVVGEASLATNPPFQLAARVELNGAAAGRRLRFVIDADGPLADFSVHGRAEALEARPGERFAGTLQARIAPFTKQALGQASAQLSGIDPAVWVAGAPVADLDIRAELRPQGENFGDLRGQLTVDNHLPGTVDKQRLPLRSLHSELDLRQDVWHLKNIDVALPGGGRLQGQGEYRQETLALDLTAERLDARAMHAAWQSTRLAGPLRVQLAVHHQLIEAYLHDPQFAVTAKLTIDPLSVVAETLQLSAGDSYLNASGQLALRADKRFDLRGRLKNFDPSRFLRLPAARLNATFEAQGQLQPMLTLHSHFQLRDSRLGEQVLAGHGEIDLAGNRLRKADVDLTAAGNRLTALGAFGAPGDRLSLRIDAPRLAPFGVDGDLHGQLILAGSLQSPEIDANLRSSRLALAKVGEIRGMDLQARLVDGERGPLSGQLRLAVLSRPDGSRVLQELLLNADGQRNRHRLHGTGLLPERQAFNLLLEGGMVSSAGDLTWRGMLSELTITSRFDRQVPILRLFAPMPLQLAAGRVVVGMGEALVGGGTLKLARLRYEGGLWQSTGSLQGLPLLPVLNEFPHLAELLAEVKSNDEILLLNGDWDFGTTDGRRLPSGRLHFWREKGDVLVNGLSLGLTDVDLALQAGSGRLDGHLRLRGQRFGEMSGQLNAATSTDSLLNPRAPWRGQLHLNIADLGWVGLLLGPVWQFAGRLAGELQLGGTPAQARLNGELRGSELAVRKLDQGLRLERGQLLLQLAGEQAGDVRLLLKQLDFESVLQSMPRPLRVSSDIDLPALLGKPGRFQASGELRAGQTDGVLNIKADRLGAWQRPDQWLVFSGDLQVRLSENLLKVLGRLQADAAYWEMREKESPRLSDDVMVKRSPASKSSQAARLLALDIDVDLGRHCLFHGVGVDSRLAGGLKIRSEGTGLPQATGTIRTVGGRFDAYGQQLEIKRGILNFNGQIDNPGLNVRAIRGNLPVEPGVEVTGSVRKPIVRLVSDPEMPDGEKLSWLILGHSSEQQGGNESAILLAAAQSLLGGQDGGPLKSIQRELGIDEFAIVSGTVGGGGRRQTSHIVGGSGFGVDDTTSSQIVSIGKRLASNMQIGYEQSLTGAGSVVKLTVNLSRNLSLIGRAGTENALDVLWNYRFGR